MPAITKKTAFLVIHGIGNQKPFETLDQFGRGLIEHLSKEQGELTLSHALQPRSGDKDDWQESFLRIHSDKDSGFIDVREFYWAHLTERKIRSREISQWLKNSLAGAKHLCEENADLKQRFQKHGGIFSWNWLHQFITISLVRVIYWFQKSWLFRLLSWRRHQWLLDYIGDIAIYTSTDLHSRHYTVRQNILRQAMESLLHLLTKHKYDRVIICGHSLGSVIAYDILNKLNVKANMSSTSNLGIGRLAGFISFGSPLDKIAFFFREHAHKDQYIRRQMIDQLFSYRAYPLRSDNPYPLIAPLKAKLDHIPWVNYYSSKDPISDHLVFCKISEQDNVELQIKQSWTQAHTAYWHNPEFYADIAKRFLD